MNGKETHFVFKREMEMENSKTKMDATYNI